MAKFEGIHWSAKQMRYLLPNKKYDLMDGAAQVIACSRSTNNGAFLAFEGIRFFCKKNAAGRLEAIFLNWDMNLERFRRGMLFNIGADQAGLVPSRAELEDVFIGRYFREPAMRGFFEEMAALGAQGYLRPFTVDEEQSIGVTFPAEPAIRAVASRYDRYLGEPFSGVVIPHLVRAVAVNGTGWLKLGVNYLMSIKAVEEAGGSARTRRRLFSWTTRPIFPWPSGKSRSGIRPAACSASATGRWSRSPKTPSSCPPSRSRASRPFSASGAYRSRSGI